MVNQCIKCGKDVESTSLPNNICAKCYIQNIRNDNMSSMFTHYELGVITACLRMNENYVNDTVFNNILDKIYRYIESSGE